MTHSKKLSEYEYRKNSRTPHVGVSHNPDIKKQVFVSKGVIPSLTGFSTATFKPGQSVDLHAHESMYEIFYITHGTAIFTCPAGDVTVTAGDCVTIDPKEEHAMRNDGSEDATWLYFGIAID